MNVEDPLAAGALEMMVMAMSGELVARVLAGQVDGLQLAFVDQCLEIAVDRGDAQSWGIALRVLENLLRQQGPLGLRNRIADRRSLAGVAFHACRVAERSGV